MTDEKAITQFMLNKVRKHIELRELLYRAGDKETAEKILREAGAGDGAKYFLQLAEKKLVSMPSAEQFMASTNFKEGETRTIIAVPGSGKTTSLIYTIEGLLAHKQAKANEITVISYTTAAAGELSSRMITRNPDLKGRSPHISTAHALARSIIRKYEPDVELNLLTEGQQDTIINETVVKRLIKEIEAKQYEKKKDYDAELISRLTKSFKSNLTRAIPNVRLAPWSKTQLNSTAAQYNLEPKYLKRALEIYEEEKRNQGMIDFEDLIWNAIKIIEENLEAKKEIQSHAKVLIVDEYQDTSPLQRAFEKCIQPEGGIKVEVGDDHQAIFTSLGANGNYLKVDASKSKNEPEKYEYHQLKVDYRGTRNCLAVANDIAQSVDNTFPKTIVAAPGAEEGALPVLAQFSSKNDEMKWILNQILTGIKEGNPPQNYAVLCRWNADCDAVEAMIRNNDEFKELRQCLTTTKANPIIGNFLENPAGKRFKVTAEALAYPDSAEHFNKLLETLSPTLAEYAVPDDDKEPLDTFIKTVRATGYETEETKTFINAWKTALQCQLAAPALATFTALQAGKSTVSDYEFSNREKAYIDEIEGRNVDRTGFFDFYSWAEEEAKSNYRVTDKEGFKVTTIHKSKGREYQNVYCFNLSEDNLKMMMDGISEATDLGKDIKAKLRNESDKIVYVGLTRAIKTLNMTYTGTMAEILKHIKPQHIRRLINEIEHTQEEEKDNEIVEIKLPKRKSISANARKVKPVVPSNGNSVSKSSRDD